MISEQNDGKKEVYFDKYCKTCQYSNLKETEEPCDECMDEPYNQNSHKPVKYLEDSRKIKKG